MQGFSIKKVAIIFFTLGIIAVIADISQHYVLLRITQTWLQTSEKRQNTFRSHLNIWPLGGASVEIKDLVSVTKEEKLTVRSIMLRKSLFNLKEVKTSAKDLKMGELTADSLKGSVQHIQSEVGSSLVFEELELDNLTFRPATLALKIPKIIGDALYKVDKKVITFTLNSQNIFINEKETIGLDVKGDLTVFTPHNGDITVKVKEIDTLSQTLVEAGYLKPNQAQILSFGGQLLGDEDGRVKVKLKFRNGDVYWGPVRLKL